MADRRLNVPHPHAHRHTHATSYTRTHIQARTQRSRNWKGQLNKRRPHTQPENKMKWTKLSEAEAAASRATAALASPTQPPFASTGWLNKVISPSTGGARPWVMPKRPGNNVVNWAQNASASAAFHFSACVYGCVWVCVGVRMWACVCVFWVPRLLTNMRIIRCVLQSLIMSGTALHTRVMPSIYIREKTSMPQADHEGALCPLYPQFV